MEQNLVKEQYNSMSFFYNVLYADMDLIALEDAFIKEHNDLLKSLDENAKILDSSCGNGVQATALCRKGYDVTASDISIEMITLASSYARANDLYFPTECMAWNELPNKYRDVFDVVFCWGNSISHSMDEEDMINNLISLNRVMKSGGKLIIHTRNWDKMCKNYQRVITYGVREYEGKKYIPVYLWNLNRFDERSNVEILFIEIINEKETECIPFRLDFTPFSHEEFLKRIEMTDLRIIFDSYDKDKDFYYVIAEK